MIHSCKISLCVCFAWILFVCGCTTGIGIEETSTQERRYYGVADFSAGTLNGGTVNLLGNYLLMDLYHNDPEALIAALELLYRQEKNDEVITALADASLQIGYRLQDDPDRSSRYFLAAAVYSSFYLKYFDDESEPYNEQRLRLIRIHNLAATELFFYLKERNLERSSHFELPMPVDGRKVRFENPVFELPVPADEVRDFSPCAGFRTRNLTHDTREFGCGVPLVATLQHGCRDQVGLEIQDVPLGVTALIDFEWLAESGEITAVLRYIYSKTVSQVEWGGRTVPLAADFSTPLAKAAAQPEKMNFLERTFQVEAASAWTGLYLFEPYDENRIPVVFVHGLMSDVRTWGQMLNTLLHDKELRQKYQFLGFSYSSGNPVFASAAILRNELHQLRARLVEQNRSTEAFDKMVLVGHSMGGLLSRLQVTSCSWQVAADTVGIKDRDELKKMSSAETGIEVSGRVDFEPAGFVKRVIFIAVPHRGSQVAESWIGKLGASLIRLPVDLVKLQVELIDDLVQDGKLQYRPGKNGIENLKPDDPMLKILNALPFAADVPLHSVIGNAENAVPGGSDGIVPYESSHLEQAASELIVKSGHSVQRNPLAIQEVRRILLLHLQENKSTIDER